MSRSIAAQSEIDTSGRPRPKPPIRRVTSARLTPGGKTTGALSGAYSRLRQSLSRCSIPALTENHGLKAQVASAFSVASRVRVTSLRPSHVPWIVPSASLPASSRNTDGSATSTPKSSRGTLLFLRKSHAKPLTFGASISTVVRSGSLSVDWLIPAEASSFSRSPTRRLPDSTAC